jgi:hypothetical protein
MWDRRSVIIIGVIIVVALAGFIGQAGMCFGQPCYCSVLPQFRSSGGVCYVPRRFIRSEPRYSRECKTVIVNVYIDSKETNAK